MVYKEPKKETPPQSNNVVYAEILSTIIMTALLCGTLLITTHMWVQERQYEIGFLRGTNP